MSDKDFKVKNKLQVKGITSAGPVVSDASGNLDSTAYIATQYGGTGTSTSPNAGQILYSASGTTYSPTDLSSVAAPSNSPTFTGNVVLPSTTTYSGTNIQTLLDSKDNLTKTVSTKIADYTLDLSDRGKIIEFNSSSDLNLTLPTYSSVSLSYGDNFSIVNRGTGKVNIINQSGTTGLTSYATTGITASVYGGLYANDQYIVNSSTSFLKSSDAISWTSAGVTTIGSGISINQRVAYGNGVWVLASSNGLYSSSSGTSFTLRQATSTHAVKYANNKFIAAAPNGTMYTSVDGITWTSLGAVAGLTTQSFYNIEYLSGINTWFATVQSSPYLIKSTDNGNTWTSVSGALSSMKVLSANDNILVLVGSNTYQSGFYTTTDGINFTTKNYGASVMPGGIIYGNGIFAHAYTIGSATLYLSTSSDGINWTTQSSIAVTSSGAGYTLMLKPSSGYSVLGSMTSNVFKAGTATTSYISKDSASYIPSKGRAEIYNYNQNQYVVSGDLGNVSNSTYSDSAPSNPAIGQVWIESDSSSDSFDPNIIRREAFTATSSQTVFTTAVTFIEGYEQVYFNGLLLLRGTDYTTSGGNTVTLSSGAAASDIIEVITVTNLNSNDTYTQSEISNLNANQDIALIMGAY